MIAINKDIYICFIDYQKVFDRVYHLKIMEFLNYTEMDKKDLRIIQNLYWEQKAVVRLQNGNSDAFNIERGVRQGCVLSPKLFNLYTEPIFCMLELPGIMRHNKKCHVTKQKITRKNINKSINKLKMAFKCL